jgi:deoxyribodipyrimidine photo-lyase
MIVASFLSKDLLIDWREGEKYFSQNLVDADVSRALPHAVFSSSTDTPPLGLQLGSNNGGWQWAVSFRTPRVRIGSISH